jgi:Holliday junction resolvase
VGEFLERRGWRWTLAAGSRGPIDLLARRGQVRVAAQIKATREDRISTRRLRPADEQRLRSAATRETADPILALACRNYVWFISVVTGDLLLEGTLRPPRYDYRGS